MSSSTMQESGSAVPIQDDSRVELAFHPSCNFSTSYQRNNKSNGQKNLRCFPGHTFDGHRSGWCGHPLIVRSRGGPADMRLIGVFTPKMTDPALSVEDREEFSEYNFFKLGEIVTREQLDEKLKVGLLAECIEGFVEEVPKECDTAKINWEQLYQRPAPPLDSDREYVFNSKSKGWHYGFLGSKKNSNTWHVWTVLALIPVQDEDHFQIIAKLDSPGFQLFCRRRNRGPLALSRVENSQLVSAVNCPCLTIHSSPEEISSAAALSPAVIASVVVPPPPPPLSSFSKKAASTTTTTTKKSTTSSTKKRPATKSSTAVKTSSSSSSSTSKKVKMTTVTNNNKTTKTNSDNRMTLLLEIVRKVQLPGATSNGSESTVSSRPPVHSALVLIPGQDAVEFGNAVLRLAKHWKQMDAKGCPLPIQQAQQSALHAPPDDLGPPFASFLLGQPDFAENLISLATWSESISENNAEMKKFQTLRAAERMLWLMHRQVLAVQRLRTEMKLYAAANSAGWNMNQPQYNNNNGNPSTWTQPGNASASNAWVGNGGWVNPNGNNPAAAAAAAGYPPMHHYNPHHLSAGPGGFNPSTLLAYPQIPISPYLMVRRRMESNTSTGSDPSLMTSDYDLEWFSKSLDALYTNDAAAAAQVAAAGQIPLERF